MNRGEVDAATAELLAIFPEDNRTPVQSFLLGNALFEIDRAQSYKLHKAAAAGLPDEPHVAWEWGMEQHRVGEYAGALKSYRQYSDSAPAFAAPYALMADCLLRLGKVDEAVVAWEKSEEGRGSVEQMEEMVCAVNRKPAPYQRRGELLAKVIDKKDVNAAMDLIALDCDFQRDWWNAGPQPDYLQNDLPAIKTALKLPEGDASLRAMECATQCAIAGDDGARVTAALEKYKFLIDADHSIPEHGGLLSAMLAAVDRSGAMDFDLLRTNIGSKVGAAARKGHDPAMWNAAAIVFPAKDDESILAFEREGWKATGDPRFAAVVLKIRAASGDLKSDDPEMLAAIKQFPDSAHVYRVAFEVADHEKKLTKQLLVDAAKAEFTKFSSYAAPNTIVIRPRAGHLRQYFKILKQMPTENAAPSTRGSK